MANWNRDRPDLVEADEVVSFRAADLLRNAGLRTWTEVMKVPLGRIEAIEGLGARELEEIRIACDAYRAREVDPPERSQGGIAEGPGGTIGSPLAGLVSQWSATASAVGITMEVRLVVDALPPIERDVITLRRLQRRACDIRSVARRLSVSQTIVRQAESDAEQRLSEAFDLHDLRHLTAIRTIVGDELESLIWSRDLAPVLRVVRGTLEPDAAVLVAKLLGFGWFRPQQIAGLSRSAASPVDDTDFGCLPITEPRRPDAPQSRTGLGRCQR